MLIKELETHIGKIKVFYSSLGLEACEWKPYLGLLPKQLASASEKRKKEFILGRLCVQHSFDERLDLLKGEQGEPVWPLGVKGSISHSKNYALAAISSDKAINSVGVDIEKCVDEKRLGVIKKMTLTPSEILLLNSINDSKRLELATIIFSAKETLYKMINPLCGCYINFHEGIFLNIDEKFQKYSIRLKSEKAQVRKWEGVYSGSIYRIGDNIVTLSHF